ncbi:MAG: response regulator [Candidatus Sumerlaeia bacterium]|nr:response regulator [Candidatus Sumerlaeia bacterium]
MTTPAPLRALIADDEPLARQRARRLLEKAGGVEIVGEACDGREALALIEALQPDVVLLDIQMPGIDGLRVLEALDDPPAVIFSTAYEHHAVRAFELEAVDYLLKPYSAERLARALVRVRRQLGGSEAREPAPRRVPVLDGMATSFVALDDIVLARIEESVVFVTRRDGERLVFDGGLQEFAQHADGASFCQVNRQAIVNAEAIESVEPEDGGGLLLRLVGGAEESASRRRARHVRALLGL